MARTIDSDRKHLTAVLSAAAAHRGTSFVEIYQNCPIFNDGAFDAIKDNDTKADAIIPLVHGEPIRFGRRRAGAKGLIRDTETGGVKVALVADVGEDALLVHDAHNPDPTMAFAISRLTDSGYLNQSPIGIFRQVERPTYDDQARAQIATAREAATRRADRAARGAHQRRRHLDRRLTMCATSQPPHRRQMTTRPSTDDAPTSGRADLPGCPVPTGASSSIRCPARAGGSASLVEGGSATGPSVCTWRRQCVGCRSRSRSWPY